MVNSSIYKNVTYEQIDNMKHALGFKSSRVRGNKHRVYEPYRNYFRLAENSADYKSWQELAKIGFAEEFTKNYFRVTEDGRYFLQLVTGVKILKECD